MSNWNPPGGQQQVPVGQPPAPGSGHVPGPAAPGPFTAGPAGPGGPGPVPQQPGPSPTPSPPSPARSGRSWPGVLALVLVVVLTAVVTVETWQLVDLSGELTEARERLESLEQGQAYDAERLDAIEGRTGELEQRLGEEFDPEAVASAVLPSVFMVVAGDFSGTAFAIGPSADDGGTNLFTNFHVVEQVWDNDGREVRLERENQRYQAEIMDVNPDADLAWLHVSQPFNGLVASGEEVRSGQPIVAVGAPHGLTDTVTTGVVSSPAQELPDGSGPWLQFDAAINPGNSGGPVINSAKEVVGIATAKRQEAEGLGFAVPIGVACDLFEVC